MDWEDLEALYWQFDAMHRGYGAWEGRPTNEKDAFKRTVKRALTENVVLYAKQVDAYRQLMEKAVRFAKVVSECRQSDCNQVDAQEYEEAQTFLKEDT